VNLEFGPEKNGHAFGKPQWFTLVSFHHVDIDHVLTLFYLNFFKVGFFCYMSIL
jgi:hypothetical protein